jgi:cell division protein FtsX
MRRVPSNELADRFAGHEVGVIGSSAIPSPGDLIIVEGHEPSQLAHVAGATEITGYATTSRNGGPVSLGSTGEEFVLALLGLVLLFPVLVFIATATRLSAARREQRFAAIRLVGATNHQLSVIAAIEAVVAAVMGVAIGVLLYVALRPAMTHFSLTGQSFAEGDVSLRLGDLIVVVVGVPLAALIAARLALRRTIISPLGVTRRVAPPPPRVIRTLPLIAGLAELGYFVSVGHPRSASGQTNAYFTSFLLIMVGIVVAGPWLTKVGATLMARRSSRASALVAGRRLADNPRGSFRTISGLILALFVTSVSFGVITTLLSDHSASSTASAASDTVIDQFNNFSTGSIPSVPTTLVPDIRRIPGVTGVSVVYQAPSDVRIDGTVPYINGISGDVTDGVVECAQFAFTPALGRCHPGATYAAVEQYIGFLPVTKSVSLTSSMIWPTAHLRHGTSGLSVQLVAVATNGTTSTIARVETALESNFPLTSSTTQFGNFDSSKAQLLSELRSTSEVVIVASLLIAGCSLAVAMAVSVVERKRPFSLLRLSGVPVNVLRRIVALETAAPLVAISLLSAILGLVASDLFLRSQFGENLRAPGAAYFAIVGGGLAASLAIIGSSLTLLEPLTRAENSRIE